VDVVLVGLTRGRPLPQIPIKGRGHRCYLAYADRLAGVAIPCLGIVSATDEAIVDLVDDINIERGGTPLSSHLDMLAVLSLSFDKKRTFSRIVTARLFNIDVLAGLKPGDGHRSMPVVGGGDGDGVYVFGSEKFAKIFVSGRGVAEALLDSTGELSEEVTLYVANVSDLHIFLVCLERGEVGVGAAVKSDDGEVKAVVGAHNLAVAFCSRADG
jgi:hypothetical protein